jgi:hypothetical protein
MRGKVFVQMGDSGRKLILGAPWKRFGARLSLEREAEFDSNTIARP